MATKQKQKVGLYWQCKTPEGWRRFRVAPGSNGRLRKGWVMDKGAAQHYPEGVYCLRSYKDGKSIYQTLTDSGGDALNAQREMEKILRAGDLIKGTSAQIVRPASGPQTLEAARSAFLDHVGLRIKARSLTSYERILTIFFGVIRKTYASEITADDLFRCIKVMEKSGKSEGTIFSYSYRLKKFLAFAGVPKDRLPQTGEMPNEPRLEVEIYDEADILTLIAGAKTIRNALLYEFLWKTGAREMEAMHVEWTDIDFARGILRLRNKPALGFRIKTSEERDVPLSPMLLASLTAYHKKHSDHRFVFGTGRNSRPRKNSLRYLKRDVWRLGLACKHCEGCRKYHECEAWKLHKFRSTYATTYLHNGGDLRTLMSLMGHQDIASTMRYLKRTTTEATKAQIARIFDGTPAANVITMGKRRRA